MAGFNWGALAAMAGPILGAGVSGGFGMAADSKQRKHQRNMLARQQAWQRENMMNQIQWRTADAKAAGIHPLYAMGAPTIGGGMMQAGDVSSGMRQMGQDLGRAVGRSPERAMSVKLMASQLAESDARKNLLEAQAAKTLQESMYGPPVAGMGVQSEIPGGTITMPTNVLYDTAENIIGGQNVTAPGQGVIDLQPNPQISVKPGSENVTAGTHGYYKEYMLESGMPMLIPYSQEGPAEALSEMSPMEKLGLALFNERVYGKGYALDWYQRHYLGMKPDHKYKRVSKERLRSLNISKKMRHEKTTGQAFRKAIES